MTVHSPSARQMLVARATVAAKAMAMARIVARAANSSASFLLLVATMSSSLGKLTALAAEKAAAA